MLNPISSAATLQSTLRQTDAPQDRAPDPKELAVREKFQEFVAGTFYKKMLTALRSTQGKPAYLHGGQVEEIFQARMDDQIADDLAKRHGEQFAGPLYSAFKNQLNVIA